MHLVDKFYLVESDWKEFTKNPSEVSFVIRLVDPDSYFTIYESERMMCRERLRGHKLFHQEHNHGSR